MLFELAAAQAVALELNITCIVAWWDHHTEPTHPFGERPGPASDITLKHIFPNLHFVHYYPLLSHTMDFEHPPLGPQCAFSQYQHDLTTLLKLEEPATSPLLHGFFETVRRFPLVHKHRDHIVNHVLRFHPAVVEHVKSKYASHLNGARETVSVHFRLGGPHEPQNHFDERMQKARGMPSLDWYKHVLTTEFDPAKVTYLVVSDHLPRAMEIMASFDAPLNFIGVEEDFVSALALMSLCEHHVGTTSTYSFWGAYLDKQQPSGACMGCMPASHHHPS